MNAPRDGITTEVKILRVIDGDTFEVEISRKIQVRLIHQTESNEIFDTPEKNTDFGKSVQEFVFDLFSNFHGKVKLFIPSEKSYDLLDILSFKRVLGEIWLGDRRLSDILLEHKYARLIKKENRTKTDWEEKP